MRAEEITSPPNARPFPFPFPSKRPPLALQTRSSTPPPLSSDRSRFFCSNARARSRARAEVDDGMAGEQEAALGTPPGPSPGWPSTRSADVDAPPPAAARTPSGTSQPTTSPGRHFAERSARGAQERPLLHLRTVRTVSPVAFLGTAASAARGADLAGRREESNSQGSRELLLKAGPWRRRRARLLRSARLSRHTYPTDPNSRQSAQHDPQDDPRAVCKNTARARWPSYVHHCGHGAYRKYVRTYARTTCVRTCVRGWRVGMMSFRHPPPPHLLAPISLCVRTHTYACTACARRRPSVRTCVRTYVRT